MTVCLLSALARQRQACHLPRPPRPRHHAVTTQSLVTLGHHRFAEHQRCSVAHRCGDVTWAAALVLVERWWQLSRWWLLQWRPQALAAEQAQPSKRLPRTTWQAWVQLAPLLLFLLLL